MRSPATANKQHELKKGNYQSQPARVQKHKQAASSKPLSSPCSSLITQSFQSQTAHEMLSSLNTQLLQTLRSPFTFSCVQFIPVPVGMSREATGGLSAWATAGPSQSGDWQTGCPTNPRSRSQEWRHPLSRLHLGSQPSSRIKSFLKNTNMAWVSSVILLVPLYIPDVFELRK